MKILQIIPSFDIAGAEKMCEHLSCELNLMGHKVVAVSLYTIETPLTENLKANGVEVRFLGKKRGLDLSIIFKLRKLIKNEAPDVIHTHLNALIYTLLSTKKRVVYTVHTLAHLDITKFIRRLNYKHYKSGRIIPVALSEAVRDSVAIEYGLNNENIPVIHNGISLKRCIVKNDYSTNGQFTLIHVGRFAHPKNHIGMLTAFEIIHNKYPNTLLRLVGDGEDRAKIEKFIVEHHLGGSVDLVGLQSNVYPFLTSADIFIFPSIYEGISVALAEAMGTGLPIVATAVGGTPDMIEDEKSGLLCGLDTMDIVCCVERYIVDESLRQKHGQAAIVAAKRFSSRTMAEKYLSVYESV